MQMTCQNCKHYHRTEDGVRGGARGYCKLKPYDAYGLNIRVGSRVACKKYERGDADDD